MNTIKIYKEDIANEMLWTTLCRLSGVEPYLNNRVYLEVEIKYVNADLDFRDIDEL